MARPAAGAAESLTDPRGYITCLGPGNPSSKLDHEEESFPQDLSGFRFYIAGGLPQGQEWNF